MPVTLPYDQTPPRRPTLDDLGGGQKEDDAEFPPDPVRMITAADVNQWQKMLEALARVCPVALISLQHRDDDTFQVVNVASPCALLTLSSVTVDIVESDVVVSWRPNALPAPAAPPMAYSNGPAQAIRVDRDGDTATLTFASARSDVTLVIY